MYKKTKNKRFSIIIIITVILISIIGITESKIPVVSDAFSYITKPIYLTGDFINDAITGSIDYITKIATLEVDNQKLIEENKKLKYENGVLMGFKQENDSLRELLGLKQQNLFDVIATVELIGIAPESTSNIFIIDKGKNDGIDDTMIAINYEGLVGKVFEVTDNTSKVMPITDDTLSIRCMVQRSREQVILKGLVNGENDANCILDYITADMDIVEGDDIITSNISEIYPEGIPVAKVTKIQMDSNNLIKKVFTKSAVDYRHFDNMLIIKGK